LGGRKGTERKLKEIIIIIMGREERVEGGFADGTCHYY
jgi:hypothetical protein